MSAPFISGSAGGVVRALGVALSTILLFGYLLGYLVPSLASVYLTMGMQMPAATRFFYSLSHFPLPLLPLLLLLGLVSFVAARAGQQGGAVRSFVLLFIGLVVLLVMLALWQPILKLENLIQQLD